VLIGQKGRVEDVSFAGLQSTGEKVKLNDNGSKGDALPGARFYDNVTPLRVAMEISAGIEYNLAGKTNLLAGIRFNNGFTDFSKDKNYKFANNAIQLMLGVYF
jgi:hypothetical protein